jgi:hypothetical protein
MVAMEGPGRRILVDCLITLHRVGESMLNKGVPRPRPRVRSVVRGDAAELSASATANVQQIARGSSADETSIHARPPEPIRAARSLRFPNTVTGSLAKAQIARITHAGDPGSVSAKIHEMSHM